MKIISIFIIFSSLLVGTARAAEDSCINFTECAAYIKASIDIEKIYTKNFLGLEFIAVIRIDLDKAFNVVSVEIVKSNGDESFRDNLLRVVGNSGPFSHLRDLPDDQQQQFRVLQLYYKEPGTSG